jgi:hypothetical protein
MLGSYTFFFLNLCGKDICIIILLEVQNTVFFSSLDTNLSFRNSARFLHMIDLLHMGFIAS